MFQIACMAATMAVLGIGAVQAAPVSINAPAYQSHSAAYHRGTKSADGFVVGLLQREAIVEPSGNLYFDRDGAMRPGSNSRIKLTRGRNGPPSRPGRARSRSSHR